MVRGSCDDQGRYRLTVYPEAAEAVVARSAGVGAPKRSPSVLDIGPQLDETNGRRPQHLARARAKIRRYCVANGCNVLISPTYSDEHLDRAADRQCVELDGRNLVRRLRYVWGDRFPYVFMAEVQPERSERMGFPIYNGMLLVPVMPRPVFDAAIETWRFGRGDGYNGVDVTVWSEKRGGAAYASKALGAYASKQLAVGLEAGRQAYRVGEGFQPRREEWVVSAPAWSAREALEVWAEHEGHELEAVREISDDEGRPVDVSWGIW